MSLCIKCGKHEVSRFKGFAKYNLCRVCGMEKGEKSRAAREQDWKHLDNIAKDRETHMREMALEGVSPALLEEVKKRGGVKPRRRLHKETQRKEDFSWIPPHMLWCALNPVLTIPPEDMTETEKEEEAAYIKGTGIPSTLAINQFKLLQGNDKALTTFFGEIKNLYAQHTRKRETKDRMEDVKQIVDIYKIIEQALPINGIVPMARRKGWLPARRENKK